MIRARRVSWSIRGINILCLSQHRQTLIILTHSRHHPCGTTNILDKGDKSFEYISKLQSLEEVLIWLFISLTLELEHSSKPT